jgi:geranylgeranyl diphosphate synthase, type I
VAENLFASYLKAKLPQVQAAVAAAAATAVAPVEGVEQPSADLTRYLYGPLAHFTEGGGKRVRPILCLLGAEAVGGDASLALSSGVAIELFQSAALIHDDIADKSELRRGNPCLYIEQGTGLAINMGDLALTQVFEVVLEDPSIPAERKPELLSILVKMERNTLEGQALDLGWARDGRWDISVDDYLYMVASKTAFYTAVYPLAAGAVATGGPAEAVADLKKIGFSAGIAFQLQDDLLNLVGDADAQGKDFRSDITEGKRTLAVVHALNELAETERAELVTILEAETADQAELARAVELIELGGGIAYCEELARTEAAKAKELAAKSADMGHITSEAADILCSMADFFIERAS